MLTAEQTLAELTKKIVEAVPELRTLPKAHWYVQRRNGRGSGKTWEPSTIGLEDVLKVLHGIRHKGRGYAVDATGLIFSARIPDLVERWEDAQWTLGKPLDQQSPETISFLSNLLL